MCSPARQAADIVIFASGSEVEIALAARKLLEEAGMRTRVVSVPSMELFARQSDAYRAAAARQGAVRGRHRGGRPAWAGSRFIGTDGVLRRHERLRRQRPL